MSRKKDVFGHPIPSTAHMGVGADLKQFPAPLIERMPPPKSVCTMKTFTVATLIMVATTIALGIIIGERFKYARLQDDYATLEDQLATDNGTLQLIFEGGYDREGIMQTAVTVSAYSSTRDQTDSTPFTTASGENTMVGQIAVSRDLFNKGLHFGSIVYLEGVGVFRVEDVMNPRWANRVDIWCVDKVACRKFGLRRNVSMLWVMDGGAQ